MADSTTRLTLVHGTFAATSSWVNENQSANPNGFRARLAQQFTSDVEFNVPPPWGSLSAFKILWDLTNTARLNGAKKLEQDILSKPKNSDEKHFLVAHSHGGNVAMYALQNPEVQQRVDGLICMATPFLYPRLRPLSILSLLLSLAIMLVGAVQLIGKMQLFERGVLAWSAGSFMLVIAVAVPAYLIYVICRERYQRVIKGDPELEEHVTRLSFKDPKIPILLIRNSGDEASGLLRGTQFLNWVAGVAMRLGGRQIYGLLCAFALILLWMADRNFSWVPDNTLSVLSTALIASAVVMVVMLIILTVSRVLVGLDAWQWVGELETMIEDGPPGIKAELVVISPRLPVGGLSHTAVYSEPETTATIASWCEKQTA